MAVNHHAARRAAAQDRDDKTRDEVKRDFQKQLQKQAERAFDAALPVMPCNGLFRPRAEARARRAFNAVIRKDFPLLFATQNTEAAAHVA